MNLIRNMGLHLWAKLTLMLTEKKAFLLADFIQQSGPKYILAPNLLFIHFEQEWKHSTPINYGQFQILHTKAE